MNQSIPEFLHRHDLYEIYYVTEGAMKCWCAGKIKELQKGNILFLGKNLDHYMIYNPINEGEYFVLIFDIEPKAMTRSKSGCSSSNTGIEYNEVWTVLNRVDEEGFVLPLEKFYEEELLLEIYKEQKQKQIGWNSMAGLLYYQFFLKALRLLSSTPSCIHSSFGYMNIALTATKYIHANYQDDINLGVVATLLNVTSRHINRLFQDMFGISFARTVNIIRMHYSKQYLRNTNKPIEWIAEHVGLPSSKSLTKLFKAQEGISPAEYRYQAKK
jgi:AraC-like DNA-binding protein